MDLNEKIGTLKGIGPKTEKVFNDNGIFTLMDLILYFPRDYETLEEINLSENKLDQKYLVRAEFVSSTRPVRTRTGKNMITLNFKNKERVIKAIYFNMPYISKNFKVGEIYNLYGKFKEMGKTLSISNPKLLKDHEIGVTENKSKDNFTEGKVIARYPLHENITENTLKKLINQVLDKIYINENLPKEIIDEFNFLSLDESIKSIHRPENDNFKKAFYRLKFQELFGYSMKIAAAKKRRIDIQKGIAFKMSPRLKELKDSIPFSLTEAQNRSIREILLDEKKEVPMNRLLQGDVGSGKTIVALIALFNVIENGYQAVFMVPTEILAKQHYDDAVKLFENFGIEVLLLTGSTKKKVKEEIKETIKSSKNVLVIGTHALLEDDIEFSNLGMVVTDEQHRFGVNQRTKLVNKKNSADVLVMSATPIPRTMALYLYSDLDLSIIDELPKGRKEIKTIAYSRNKEKEAYLRASVEIRKGRQVYIVCPLIEDSEKLDLTSIGKLCEKLKSSVLSEFTIEILHGRMKAKEKNDIINEFKNGNIDILISTTVIEVGVNVPNASVMIIENAERFGLSQLHQLRGRVGRGEYESHCILISDSTSDDTLRRMEIMTSTNNGFKIAEEDLKLRGTGAIFGTNQSGESGLVLSNFVTDYDIFIKANKWANIVFSSNKKGYIKVKEDILRKVDKTLDLICLN